MNHVGTFIWLYAIVKHAFVILKYILYIKTLAVLLESKSLNNKFIVQPYLSDNVVQRAHVIKFSLTQISAI